MQKNGNLVEPCLIRDFIESNTVYIFSIKSKNLSIIIYDRCKSLSLNTNNSLVE